MRCYHRFKERLVFKQIGKVADGQGGSITSESTLMEVWASAVYPKFGAVLSAGKLGYDYDATFTVRYNSTILQGMEFLLGVKRYRILYIVPDETLIYEDLICKELV